MEIEKQFVEATVYIECIAYQGSGCLIQPDTEEYSYVLTAKHCLIGKEDESQKFDKDDIIILRYKNQKNQKKIKVLEYYLHPQKDIDLAIIKVEFEKDLRPLRSSKAKFDENIYIWGYPAILDKEDDCDKLDFFKGEIGRSGDGEKKLEFKMINSNETYDTSKTTNLEGFSGGGIFSKTEGDIIFHGIFEGLKESKGVFDGCLGCSIEVIKIFIQESNLKPLIHYKLSSFKFYKDESFKCHDRRIGAVLKRREMDTQVINPHIIINKRGRKIFIPYKSENVYEDKLWQGWLRALAYLKINNIRVDDIEEIYYENTLSKEKYSIKILYALKGARFKDVLRDIFEEQECYDDLGEGDILIINAREEIARDYIYSRKNMNKIIGKIDDVMMLERGLYIDNPEFGRNISGIHINEFSNRIEAKNDEEEFKSSNIESEIKKIVEGVLMDAIQEE